MGFDLGGAATTLGATVNKVVSNTGLASGLTAVSNSIGGAAGAIKDSITSGFGGLNLSSVTNLIPGAAQVQSALSNAKSNVNKLGNLFENAASGTVKVPSGTKPGEPIPNVLHYYSSFNYIFSLSVLDDFAINFPNETYRKGIIGPLILKSANGNPGDRLPTPYKTKSNPSGSFEFFIENFSISSAIGMEKRTGNSNATGFKMKIVEPYSMGLFFEVLQTAALAAGHPNYTQCPLLLTLEFKGHIDADLQNQQIDKTTKYFPLKLSTLGMKVSGKGSEYDIEAYPFNESAYSSIYSELKTEASITGQSVKEMLQTGKDSLQAVLNRRLQQAVRRKDVNVADQILITFPKDVATGPVITNDDDGNPLPATTSPTALAQGGADLFKKLNTKESSINKTQVQEDGTFNDIGSSTMGFSLYRTGPSPFTEDSVSYDKDTGIYSRGNVTMNPKEGVFKFAQGTDIINAINQVILMSEYGRTALTQISESGFVQWWRIETQMFYIPTDENLAKTGVKPKLVVFRVVPYQVSAGLFLPPNTANPGTEKQNEAVLKEYNYIYTGKNTDIIDWNIEFEAGFYTAMNADGSKNNGDAAINANSSGASDGPQQSTPSTPNGQAPVDGQIPTTVLKDGVLTSTAYKGGGSLDDNASLAARQFHAALTSGVDMVALDLTILGDPYFLGDSGMGNYSAVSTDNPHLTADGSLNYQNGEVHVRVNFKNPIDIDQASGLYDFTSTAVSQFSGLYRVVTVESSFSRGKFTQQLKMFRLKGQEIKSTEPPKMAVTPTNDITPYSNIQTFDDGSSIQTFDDGSTLVTDTEGKTTSTPAPE